MKRYQIEKLYEENRLTDYKLRTTDDLMQIHSINFKEVEGYIGLDDINKVLYEKAIVNIYNGLGLSSRATMIPKGIYYVEDVDYLVKVNPDDVYYTVAGRLVMSIDKTGSKAFLRLWQIDDYKHLKTIKGEAKYFLRFEYEQNDRAEWLHISDEKTWY
jgi:hypothetical protein